MQPAQTPAQKDVTKGMSSNPPREIPYADQVIRVEAETLTAKRLADFRSATVTTFAVGMPPTLATIYRASEFEWLARLKIDMRQLLHTDQEYEYLVPLEVGDAPIVTTRVKDYRERRGMQFYVLESDIAVNGVVKLYTRSSFIVRRPE